MPSLLGATRLPLTVINLEFSSWPNGHLGRWNFPADHGEFFWMTLLWSFAKSMVHPNGLFCLKCTVTSIMCIQTMHSQNRMAPWCSKEFCTLKECDLDKVHHKCHNCQEKVHGPLCVHADKAGWGGPSLICFTCKKPSLGESATSYKADMDESWKPSGTTDVEAETTKNVLQSHISFVSLMARRMTAKHLLS